MTGEEKGEEAERAERVAGKEVAEKEVGWVEAERSVASGGGGGEGGGEGSVGGEGGGRRGEVQLSRLPKPWCYVRLGRSEFTAAVLCFELQSA